jgi:hypothetical protein
MRFSRYCLSVGSEDRDSERAVSATSAKCGAAWPDRVAAFDRWGEDGAADAVHAVGGPGEVGGQLDDVAEEGLSARGVLEQVGVCRRGGDVTGVVQ